MRDVDVPGWLLGLALAIGQIACSGDRVMQPVAPSLAGALFGTEWMLTEVGGQPAGTGAGGALPSLVFSEQGARASGFAGCNRYTAGYVLTAETLQFGPVAMTRIACREGMELEQRFAAALEAARGYRLSGRRLELLDMRGVVARFDAH